MGQTNFARMDLLIEPKCSNSEDAFHDSCSFQVSSPSGALTRGQLAFYTAAQMHVFSLLIRHDRAHLIRWDRAGAIVTKSFNCVQSPRLLVEFYWKYTRFPSDQDCGDPAYPLEGFEHYQMVLRKVGHRLKEFKSTQLVTTIADAMEPKRYGPLALCLMYDTQLPSKRSPPGCFQQGENITPRHWRRKHRHRSGWERDVDAL
ncbi:hypothetical protein BS47DRAFT_627686 [Hydnum rufescens UP504]|uniref:Fungal-type protein kinase domain-containing protein n=1 Tax=Hydnum rufescens UP504 TaxID=1448309 RepID=A0A9P6DZH2_9AGAM|nr:hypothetical protein BS47DRAFT_627686 [Hydnum rufescens UP504]